jgi:hypothetical protein
MRRCGSTLRLNSREQGHTVAAELLYRPGAQSRLEQTGRASRRRSFLDRGEQGDAEAGRLAVELLDRLRSQFKDPARFAENPAP